MIPATAFTKLYNDVNDLGWFETPKPFEVAVFSYDPIQAVFTRDPINITDDSPSYSGIAGIAIRVEGQEVQDGISLTEEELQKHAEDERSRCYVGYDVEYTPLPPDENGHPDAELVSHQFYIAHDGQRKAFILLTDERFLESQFVDLIAHIAPPDLKSVYVSAHFSLIECGWLIQDSVPAFQQKHLSGYHSNPTTYLPLLVASAYIKSCINRIFIETPTSLSRNAYLKLTDCEQCVSSPYGDEYDLVDISSISDDIKNKIIKTGSPKSALWAVAHGEIKLFHVRDELTTFLKEARRRRPVIEKLEKAWIGKIRLVKKEILQDYEKSAQRVLNLALEEMADSLGFQPSTVSIPKLGETNEARQQREARADARAMRLREVYLEKVHGWLTSGDEKAWQFSARRNAEGKRINRSKELTAHNRSLPETNLLFVDSVKFGPKALKDLGKIIGIGKIEIDESDISDMNKMLVSKKLKFCEYAIRDSVVAAEAVAWFARVCRAELKVELKTRVAAYTAAYFKDVFEKDVYSKDRVEASGLKWNENVKFCLGWTPPPKKVDKSKRSQLDRLFMQGENATWMPSIQMQQFAKFYAGGWGAVFKVGSLGKCTYWDLKSAYPCAYMMLEHDYHFGHPISLEGDAAEQAALEMVNKKSPFQIAGLEVAFEFKDTVIDEETGKEIKVEPFFPIRLDESDVSPLLTPEADSTLIFTKSGTTNVMFPEYYAAVERKLLKWHKVLSLETYAYIKEKDPNTGNLVPAPSMFAQKVREAIEKRGKKGRKEVYKSILNYLYGKFCESISKTTVYTKSGPAKKKRYPGPLTCYPLAAYATSVCRAVMGELLNKGNECYAITTDGFISPERVKLKEGEIAKKTHDALKHFIDEKTGKNYSYIEAAYEADESLFIKTRGYMLHGTDDEGKEALKIALMSAQTTDVHDVEVGKADPRALEFMEALRTGVFTKRSFHSFKVIRSSKNKDKKEKNIIDTKPLERIKESRLSTSFDMRRIPVEPIFLSTFKYYGAVYSHPLFSTRALSTRDEYIRAKKQLRRQFELNEYHDFAASFVRRTVPSSAKAPIICLCGSTEHKQAMLDTAASLTLDGNVVLMPLVFSQSDGMALPDEQIAALHQLHQQKIDLCDSVFVVNPDGRIGESTSEEIEYAESRSKEIRYMIDVADPEESDDSFDPDGLGDPEDLDYLDPEDILDDGDDESMDDYGE